MDQMKDILERYWNCETTAEEEQFLREWFREGDVPDELAKYSSVFLLQNYMAEQKASPALRQNISDSISNESKKSRTFISFYPAMKVAASALIIISLGIGINTHYKQEKFLEELFSETYTNPEDALKETRAALDKVSSSFSKAQETFDELQSGITSDSIPTMREDTTN